MGNYGWIAEALAYPAPGRLEALRAGLEQLPESDGKSDMAKFFDRVGSMSLEEWEELHTRTLDLDPPAAPYIGFLMWGDSYKRGNFMATLNRVMRSEGISLDGELPDHLVPVLRLLDHTNQLEPPLDEVLEPALRQMRKLLVKAEPRNPYVSLLDAVLNSLPAKPPNQPGEKML